MTATTAEQRADWSRLADRIGADPRRRDVLIRGQGADSWVEPLPFHSIDFDAATDAIVGSVGGRCARCPVVWEHLVPHPREIRLDVIPHRIALEILDEEGTTTLVSLVPRLPELREG